MNLAIKICTSAVLIAAASAFAENVKTLELTPTEGMTRANLSYIIPEDFCFWRRDTTATELFS